jgi:hypothetical protein
MSAQAQDVSRSHSQRVAAASSYEKRGYGIVEWTDATQPHYRSVIMSKTLHVSAAYGVTGAKGRE